MLMRGVIVDDDVQRFVPVDLTFHFLDELEELFVGVLLVTLTRHASSGNVECRKKSTRPVSLIVMRDGSTASFLQWQTRLGAI
jgi:hypothetical protein